MRITEQNNREDLRQKEKKSEIKTARRIIELIEKRGGESYLYYPDKALVRCKDIIDLIKKEILGN